MCRILFRCKTKAMITVKAVPLVLIPLDMDAFAFATWFCSVLNMA